MKCRLLPAKTLLGALFSNHWVLPTIFEENVERGHQSSAFLRLFLGALLGYQAVCPKIFGEKLKTDPPKVWCGKQRVNIRAVEWNTDMYIVKM